MNYKKILFSIAFVIIGLIFLQIPVTHLVGSKATFTLFDSFSPIIGGFVGPIIGAYAVLAMQLLNFFVHGSTVFDAGMIIRLVVPLFAVLYFAKKTQLNIFIPVLAILVFNLNPVGRSVWFYSLLWLIPIACYFLQERYVFARALGATFTAHAVGGALWIWTIHLPAAVWTSLIPVVLVERFAFAVGITASYLLVRALVKQRSIYRWLNFKTDTLQS